MVSIVIPLLETNVFRPRSEAIPEDDWPEFGLKDVEVTLSGPSPQPPGRMCSLLEAGDGKPVKVVGKLEALASDQKSLREFPDCYS